LLLLALSYFAVPNATTHVFAPLAGTAVAFAVIDIVAIGANPELRAKESWLTVSATLLLFLSGLVATSSLEAVEKYLPAIEAAAERKRQVEEYERYQRRLRAEQAEEAHTVAVPIPIAEPERPSELITSHEEPESEPEVSFGHRLKNAWLTFVRFTGITLPLLILHIAIVVILVLMTADLILRAFDSSREAPGRLWDVQSPDGGGEFRLHLACGAFGGKHRTDDERFEMEMEMAPESNATLPRRTLLFFSPSGVAGYVAAEWALNSSSYDHPSSSPPSTDLETLRTHAHQRICYFDRPGYGFSDNAPSARLGATVEALEQALEKSSEMERLTGRGGGRDLGGFVLVGQGYGG